MRTILAWALLMALAGAGRAHVPYFPDGADPVVVDAPTVSKAYYLRSEPGAVQEFVVAPVERSVPVQLLVLDDEAGGRLAYRVRLDCGSSPRELRPVDVPFYEPFSRLAHRIRVADALGPSATPCRIEVAHVGGPAGPYTLVVGDEERFGFGDVLGLFTLERRLRAWREGP